MKKLIGFILLLAALCVCFSAYAAENGSGDHLTWELDEKGTLTISGTGDMDKTFNQNAEIKAVVIGNGITRVCDSAFYFCENLKSVSFPNSLKEIGNYVFYGCTKLTGVTLPDSLNSIGTSAFGYCPGMTGITIPNQVKTIGDSAFGDITIYARLGTDGAKALGKAGISFRVPNGQYQLRYRYEGDQLQDLEVIAVDNGVTKLVIPKGVTRIAAYAFSDNNALTDVVIPDGVKSIGQDAFASCSGIKNLVIPASVTSIEKGAFSHWNGNLVFQGAAPAIDAEAFYYGSVVAVYPHDRSGWDTAAKKSFAAKWINWQADNAEAAKDTKPRTQTETLTQTLTDNESDHNYGWNWADTTDSYLVPEADGAFTRVEHVGESIIIEQYSKETELQWKKTLPMELPLWGGFFSGKDYYFFVFGQTNYEENDKKEVLRVVRYGKNWNRIDSASAFGQNTTTPFRGGTVDMDQGGDYLYIHTCHEMYTSSDGLRHQSNMTFKLYIPGMSFSIDQAASPGYTSHSFNQIIYVDEGNVIMVDHGDAYPRAITIGRMTNDTEAPGYDNYRRVTLLKIGGETGDNYTGATVGGSEASDTRYIVTGKSIDQANFNTSTRDNVYVVTASKSDFTDASVTFRWQTNYPEGSTVVLSNPYLIRITGQKLLLIWTEQLNYSDLNVLLHYVFLDENGKASSQVYTNPGKLSDVMPVINGNYLTWYVTTGADVIFYSLDLTNPELITTVQNLVWLGKAGWQQDNAGHWLYGNSEGYALTGVQYIDRKFYYFDDQGIMQTGWIQNNTTWYYAMASGVLCNNGWTKLGETWYYFHPTGAMAVGWLSDGNVYYYLNESGIMQTGWVQVDGKWYYMNASGVMQTGWIQSGGAWYYLDRTGVMQTGWIRDGGKWYYMSAGGAMQTGWVKDGDNWYYMNAGGAMQTGWIQSGGGWYYLDASGVMRTGWVKDGGKWYYMSSGGAMQTGWVQVGDSWYYMNAGGAMQTGWKQIGDNWYHFDHSGKMTTGWFEDQSASGKPWYWFDEQGVMAAGWKEIGGKWEKFSDYGQWEYTWSGQ